MMTLIHYMVGTIMTWFTQIGLTAAFLLLFAMPCMAEVPISFFPDPENKIATGVSKKLAETVTGFFTLHSPESPYRKVKLKLLASSSNDQYLLNVYLFHKSKYYCEIHTLKVDMNFQVIEATNTSSDKKTE